MKRTLLLTHEYPPFHGGVGNYCYGLFSHLPQQNYVVAHDMKLPVVSYQLKDRKNDLQLSTYNLQLIGKFFRPRWLTGYHRIKKLCGQEKIELIFTPHILPLGQVAEKINQTVKIPYILSLHGLDINLALQKNRTTAVRLLNNAQHVIANSELTRNIVASLLPADKLTVITPYYNSQLTGNGEQVAAIKNAYGHKKIILTVSRLVTRKNHAAIIKAVHALGRDDIQYLIIGQGPELATLQQLTKDLKIAEQVTFLTNVPDDQVPNYYQAADIFILPTLNLGADIEGYGIVYLEAAHFKLPIIAGQGTSAEEIIQHGHNGLLIDSTSLEALTANLKYLLDQPEIRQQLGQAAYSSLQTLPNWTDKAAILNSLLS
ncbi:MAG: glycosyltransferase family 4 protein [Candidatus Komeilibacteria bacterium]